MVIDNKCYHIAYMDPMGNGNSIMTASMLCRVVVEFHSKSST